MALGGSSRNTMVAQANARVSAGDNPAAVRIYRKLLKSESSAGGTPSGTSRR